MLEPTIDCAAFLLAVLLLGCLPLGRTDDEDDREALSLLFLDLLFVTAVETPAATPGFPRNRTMTLAAR